MQSNRKLTRAAGHLLLTPTYLWGHDSLRICPATSHLALQYLSFGRSDACSRESASGSWRDNTPSQIQRRCVLGGREWVFRCHFAASSGTTRPFLNLTLVCWYTNTVLGASTSVLAGPGGKKWNARQKSGIKPFSTEIHIFKRF